MRQDPSLQKGMQVMGWKGKQSDQWRLKRREEIMTRTFEAREKGDCPALSLSNTMILP
jgi:hypothetical protein